MDLSPIAARTDAVTRRIRLARALRAGTATLAPGVAGIALAVAATRLGWIGAGDLRVAIAIGVGLPGILTAAAATRALPSLLSAEILDRTHALAGRFTTALELAQDPSPLAQLAIEDALARAKDVSAARAFPIRAPSSTRALVLAVAALLVATTLHRPPPPEPLPPPPARLAALLVHPDDLALERDALERLEGRSDPTPELRSAIDDTNALLEALEDRSVDRTEALRRLGELAARLDRPRPTSLVAREEVLQAIGDRLGRGETTSDLAQALREHDADAAQRALEALADRVREGALSAEERRRLREALDEARADESETDLLHDELEQAEAALEEQQAQPSSEESERLLEQRREEVEQLRQQHEQRMEAERELERLERELGEAADEMSDDSEGDQDAAQSLDDAAEDLNRTARDQASEEQMQQLAQQLRQLREMIRRQREQRGGSGEDGEGGDGSGQGSESGQGGRMDRYVLRAGGGEDGTGGGMRLGIRSGGGSSGEGETEGTQGEGGEEDDGTPGGTSGSAQGEDGEGGDGQGDEGEDPQQMLILGDEGDGASAILELPGMGQSGTGDARGGGQGEGDERGGAGTDHDPASLDDPTDRSGDHRTVAVQGQDQGRGPSRSEVIRGGAAQGFASRDYERVYADYEAHAERAIEEDEIPPGYRFYVRRYFDLIRPRD